MRSRYSYLNTDFKGLCTSPNKEPSLTVRDVKFRMFDQVTCEIKVEVTATHNSFLQFKLLSPKIETSGEDVASPCKKAKLS
ncbi:hypothetical protein AC249_AIPGENE4629 [Exaiptasia diaphana]|nr:hypothetical protein AC249_AIPGENE4629 [Exaiptasia diaphana]